MGLGNGVQLMARGDTAQTPEEMEQERPSSSHSQPLSVLGTGAPEMPCSPRGFAPVQ